MRHPHRRPGDEPAAATLVRAAATKGPQSTMSMGDDEDDDIPPARPTTVSKIEHGSSNSGSGGLTHGGAREVKEHPAGDSARQDRESDD